MNVTRESILVDGNHSLHKCQPILRPNPETLYNGTSEYIYWTTYGFLVVNITLAIGSVIFGVITWIFIRQWRRLAHYVFLNLIAVCGILSIFTYVLIVENTVIGKDAIFFGLPLHKILTKTVYSFSWIGAFHWLTAATVMFYLDIVKVYNNSIRRRYLIVTLFGWAVPILEATVIFTTVYLGNLKIRFVMYCTVIIATFFLLVNTVLYVRLIYTLITGCRNNPSISVRQNVYLSTAACITSGISFYSPSLVLLYIYFFNCSNIVERLRQLRNIGTLVIMANVFMIIVYFLSMRIHRDAWREYRRRRRERSFEYLDKGYCAMT